MMYRVTKTFRLTRAKVLEVGELVDSRAPGFSIMRYVDLGYLEPVEQAEAKPKATPKPKPRAKPRRG